MKQKSPTKASPSPKKKGNAANTASSGKAQMTNIINGESIIALLSNPVKSTLVS